MASYLTPDRVNLKAKHLLFRQVYMCVPTCTHAQVESIITIELALQTFEPWMFLLPIACCPWHWGMCAVLPQLWNVRYITCTFMHNFYKVCVTSLFLTHHLLLIIKHTIIHEDLGNHKPPEESGARLNHLHKSTRDQPSHFQTAFCYLVKNCCERRNFKFFCERYPQIVNII